MSGPPKAAAATIKSSPSLVSVGFMSSLMFIATTIVLYLLQVGNVHAGKGHDPKPTDWINYSTVTGYFLQDDNSTNATTFDFTASSFGLINRTYAADIGDSSIDKLTQWQRFARQVLSLNRAAPSNINYKVLFLGRHGEGYHNAAETFYGTPAWNCYWAQLDGNATVTWADAALTPNGVAQALKVNSFWASQLSTQHIPAPQSYYTSPLKRCLQTANLTFSGLSLPKFYPFIPTVKELFREGISIHTCDRRSNKTYIHSAFPSYRIEHGFTESDELWSGTYAESSPAEDVRSKAVLDQVFERDAHTWLSITSHSGEIASILRVLGHRTFSLNTGAVIPVLVKAEVLKATNEPSVTTPAWTLSATCTAPPVTSLSTGGCVCSGSASASATVTAAASSTGS